MRLGVKHDGSVVKGGPFDGIHEDIGNSFKLRLEFGVDVVPPYFHILIPIGARVLMNKAKGVHDFVEDGRGAAAIGELHGLMASYSPEIGVTMFLTPYEDKRVFLAREGDKF